MENASKALLIAASILIAILILTIATRLFKSASSVTKSYDKRMETVQAATFNANFNKFIGGVLDEHNNEKQKYATIYDVISTANFAYDYNSKQVIDQMTVDTSTNPTLVQVDLQSKDGTVKITDLQKHSKIYDTLIQECHYQNNRFPNANKIITYEIVINHTNSMGRINHVTFIPIVESPDGFTGISPTTGIQNAITKLNMP